MTTDVEEAIGDEDVAGMLSLQGSACFQEVTDSSAKVLGDVPLPSVDYSPYLQGVADAHAYYTDPRNNEGSFNERLRKRNSIVRKLFQRLRDSREPLMQDHRVYKIIEIRCKNSRPGGHKSCPGEYNFGGEFVIVAGSVGQDGSGIKSLTGSGSVLAWNQRKTGEGTNHAKVWATAQLTPAAINGRLKSERNLLRIELAARKLPDDQAIDPLDP